MVRNFKRTTDKGLYNDGDMKKTVKNVKDGATFAAAALQFKNKETLRRKF